MRPRAAAVLLLLAACGGAPFTAALEDAAGETARGVDGDAPDGGAPDAGARDARDAPADALPADAPADAAPSDAAPPLCCDAAGAPPERCDALGAAGPAWACDTPQPPHVGYCVGAPGYPEPGLCQVGGGCFFAFDGGELRGTVGPCP
jgi:hypothetical protein